VAASVDGLVVFVSGSRYEHLAASGPSWRPREMRLCEAVATAAWEHGRDDRWCLRGLSQCGAQM